MKESPQWKPSRWSENAIRLRVKRIYKEALKQMGYIIGPHDARLIYAELMNNMKQEQSRNELHRRGIRLIGDAPLS